MAEYKLFYLLLGCTPPGRHTEQHDVFFGIGDELATLIPDIQRFWPEANGKIHIDAWREVAAVDGYRVRVEARADRDLQQEQLFFINLGGYLPGSFEEYHHKLITIAGSMGAAVQRAKQTAFYKDYNAAAKAGSHIDNKYGVDVDDVCNVEDILPGYQKKRFMLTLTKEEGLTEDAVGIGYLKLDQLRGGLV
ncbi:DUF1543 domain-containing protein [Niabella drilacis]|uniref:DUF1543 domain-containing protein n=1 Tax=Niabella drilacis (strain DSM 25811 / CCM 8410 / CCUG 62505 / LMG 26954 / E90) TaxID=1285928 RepID=A0A1G7AVQ3_NIADE|nr:DUF1543 domain-containing protein [Niabella drilacis]SDE18861.1 protein of unknown function [Niabella drilacis]